MPKLRALDKWMTTHSPDDIKTAAKAAKTSVETLRHYQHGRRAMGPDFAIRVAKATGLKQTELCTACGKCPLLK